MSLKTGRRRRRWKENRIFSAAISSSSSSSSTNQPTPSLTVAARLKCRKKFFLLHSQFPKKGKKSSLRGKKKGENSGGKRVLESFTQEGWGVGGKNSAENLRKKGRKTTDFFFWFLFFFPRKERDKKKKWRWIRKKRRDKKSLQGKEEKRLEERKTKLKIKNGRKKEF